MKKGQMRYSRGYLLSPQMGRSRQHPRERRFRKEKPWKGGIIFILILFLVLALGYTLFLSPIFRINEIKISNNRALTSEEIRGSLDSFIFKKFLIFFNQNNIFLSTENRLTNALINDFSRISSVEIDKNIFKKTINLKIIERKELGIFCKGDPASQRGECYYIDKDGVVFERAPQTSGTLILVIKDNSGGAVELGKNVIEEKFMTELIGLRNYLSNQLSLKVLDFIIDSTTSQDLKVNTNEEWYILFDRSRDLRSQTEALRLVLEEKIKEERKELEYIDLRIENRAYYKIDSQPSAGQP